MKQVSACLMCHVPCATHAALECSDRPDAFVCHGGAVQDQLNNVARFLEGRGLVEQALELATEPDYRFELAVQLGQLDTALSIAETADSEAKWRQLGELALANGQLQVLSSPLAAMLEQQTNVHRVASPACACVMASLTAGGMWGALASFWQGLTGPQVGFSMGRLWLRAGGDADEF